MANLTPEEINKQFERLKQLATTLNKDLSKLNLKPIAEDATVVAEILGKWQTEFDESLRSIDNLSSGFKSVVQEISKGNIGLGATKKTFNSLSSIAQKLQYQQAGINELSLAELKILQRKSQQEKVNAENNNKLLTARLKLLKNDEFAEDERKKISEAIKENEGIINEQNAQYKDLNKFIKENIESETELNKTLGLTGQAFKGIAKTLQNIGVESEAIDEINTSMRQAAKEGKALKVVTEGLKGSFRAIKESLFTDPAVQLAFLTKTFKTLYDIGANFSKDTANLARELGMSSKNAAVLNREFYNLTLSSKSAFGNQQNFLEATLRLNESLGTSAIFSEDVLSTQAQISKVTGLTAEESADIYKLSLLNNKTQEEVYDSVGAIRKGNLNNKKVLQEVLKTSGQLAAQYKNNPILLGKAVVQAQKLGMTLEQTKNISSKLLNFEDSISAELEAELLTGRDLNLERARYLALMGDSAGAAEELMKNLGPNGLEKFQKMNVIQQEAYARALGMSADELADSLVKERQLQKLGAVQRNELNKRVEALKEAGEYEKAAQLEKLRLAGKNLKLSEQQLDAQARIAQATDTFKSAIQAVIAGPLGKMADKVARIMETINESPFAKAVLGGIGSVGAIAAVAGSVFLIGKTLVNSFKDRPTGNPGNPVHTTIDGGTPGTGKIPGTGGTGFGGGMPGRGLFGEGGYAKDLFKGGRAGKVARGRTMRGLKGGLGKGLLKGIPYAGALLGAGVEFAEGGFSAETIGRAALSGLGGFGGGALGSLIAPGVGTVAGGVGGAMAGDALGDLIFGEREKMAAGGIVTKPTRALVGEAGAEAVIPLDKLMAEFREMRAILTQIANREGNVYLDGTKVGKAMAMSTYKS